MSYSLVVVRQLGLRPYELVSSVMSSFTNTRNHSSYDEIWLVQHPPVFTKGKASKDENVLQPGTIPVIQSDRGGQVTFHGPGQQIVYILLDLRRRRLGVRDLVTIIEQSVISTLTNFSIIAYSKIDAPGVYVGKEKICSLGLRISNGCSLHGFALNIAMDLSPFLRINPCGYKNLRMTQVSELSPGIGVNEVIPVLMVQFLKRLNSPVSDIKGWDPSCYIV